MTSLIPATSRRVWLTIQLMRVVPRLPVAVQRRLSAFQGGPATALRPSRTTTTVRARRRGRASWNCDRGVVPPSTRIAAGPAPGHSTRDTASSGAAGLTHRCSSGSAGRILADRRPRGGDSIVVEQVRLAGHQFGAPPVARPSAIVRVLEGRPGDIGRRSGVRDRLGGGLFCLGGLFGCLVGYLVSGQGRVVWSRGSGAGVVCCG
jgi:hypothetical protein